MAGEEESSDTVSQRGLSTGVQPTVLAAPGVAPTVDWTGREVAGRYRILERIGEGGMGVVYAAEHLQLKKKVAFKVIHPALAANEELLLRFKREALATGQLDHPHIASAIDLDQLEDGSAFIVMPFIRGHSLQAEIDSHGKMEYRRACRLCAQVADALSAAHAVGIVHRDLKPDNVLIEKRIDGTDAAKVLDFGVASLTGRAERISIDTAKPLTQAGTVLGTPGYMSPEQATAGEIDHRTDLYALGVMLWELCRGERLFDGEDVTAIFAKQFKQVPSPLELGNSQSAIELTLLVQALLAWNKADRPNSAAEVREALRRLSGSNEDATLPVTPAAALTNKHTVIPYAIAVFAVLIALLAWFGPSESDDEQPGDLVTEQQAAKIINDLPKELRDAIDDVVNARNREVRREAAKRIQDNPGKAPKYAELVAALELAGRCPEKKDLVTEMATLGDPRVLPALDRLSAQKHTGCGFLRLTDCLSCLRRDLDEIIAGLETLRTGAPVPKP